MKIYVASSWRNPYYGTVLKELGVIQGVELYDFKQEQSAFSWSETFEGKSPIFDKEWPIEDVARSIQHPLAERGYKADMGALALADLVVLVLPCGRSAHFEAGWGAAAGKPLLIYAQKGTLVEPELVYRAGIICTSLRDVVTLVDAIRVNKRENLDESGEPGRAPSNR